MRIVQLVTRRQHRGAEVFASQLSEALVARGHQVSFVGLYPPVGLPLQPAGVEIGDLGSRSEGRLSWRRVLELGRRLREMRPEIVQANGSDTLKYAVLAKWASDAEWPIIYRNISIASHWLRYPGQRAWGKWLLRGVDHVASVSREGEEDFRRTYAVPPTRISTIPIGTPLVGSGGKGNTAARLRALVNTSAAAEVLVHVGSFSPEKNHAWLLESFVEIRNRCPRSHLVLVGDGPLRERMETLVREKGLAPAVTFLGRRGDVPELLAGADLLLLPSRIEGIPGVILEAAAQGVPCVATDVGGMREAVDDGRTGVLVPLGDRSAFVTATVSLLEDAALRRRMGEEARSLVEERYSLDRVVGAFEELYLSVRARSRG